MAFLLKGLGTFDRNATIPPGVGMTKLRLYFAPRRVQTSNLMQLLNHCVSLQRIQRAFHGFQLAFFLEDSGGRYTFATIENAAAFAGFVHYPKWNVVRGDS